jgi:hypothetical protein
VGLDGVAQQRDAVGEVLLPERGVPLGEGVAAPDVVDEDVQAAAAVGDAADQRPHLIGVGVVTADGWPGNEVLRGADRPYSTYECVVYRIANGKVAESTTYINWLDPYVQVGLVDMDTVTR